MEMNTPPTLLCGLRQSLLLLCCLQAMEEEFALEFVAFEKFYSSSDADCPPYPLHTDSSAKLSSSKLHGAVHSSSAI